MIEINSVKKTKYVLFLSFFAILLLFNNNKIAANSEQLPALGVIDTPVTGSSIKDAVIVSGWALDGNGVTKVEVLIDGKIIGLAEYGLSRPDVLKVFPQYENANSGFQFSLDTKSLSNGQHTLIVRATGNNGAAADLQNITVNVQNLPTIGVLDSPAAGSVVFGETDVRGWVLDSTGVSKVEVLVDGNVIGQAQYGLSRPDVQKVFPKYQTANAGYEYTLNTAKFSNGQHEISIRATGNNGATTVIQSKTVNIQNLHLPVIGHLDSPTDGSNVYGVIDVRGWALDGTGVSKVEVLVDGNVIGQAQYGISRPDVLKVFSKYQNANSGYLYSLDTEKFLNGIHEISVRATGNNGIKTVLQSISVNVKNISDLPAMGSIDDPIDHSMITGITNVRGWVLDGSGVAKVEVLVDGNLIGQAEYGLSRPDVHKVLPYYQNSNAGYQFNLNSNILSNGIHTITVRSNGNNGKTTEIQNKTVNVQNLPLIGHLDSPASGSLANGKIDVSGWFLDGTGVDKVEVFVDGRMIGQAQYGLSRPDVLKVVSKYQNGNAGFLYSLDTNSLSNGNHMITVKAAGVNGNTAELESISVNVQNLPHLPTKGVIDFPTNGSSIAGITTVRGWYLDGSGVSKIEVFMDGTLIGQAGYGLPRTDVQKVFPEYYNANSGFQFAFDTINFSNGQHTLTVKETGKSGAVNSISISVTVNNGNPYLTLDLRKPANITAADIINFFDSKRQSNNPLKDYAQVFIDAQNRYGVNAQYLVAHAIWETGWGKSGLIGYKNNLYGYGAYDPCPFTCGYYFESVPDSIYRVAYQVRVDYLNESGQYFNGPNLIGMNVKYATDQNWKNGIANLMNGMKPFESLYYSRSNELAMSAITPPPLVRDIPAGKPYPQDVILSFPSGITAKVVNTPSVNFRSLPYVSSSFNLGSLAQNTSVTILGYNTDVVLNPGVPNYSYRWYRVNANGQNGWLYGQYLAIENLLQVVNIDSGSVLNIRDGNSTSAGVIASVTNGTYLKAVTQNGSPVIQNGWYNVYLPNSASAGWVSGEFINRIVN